MAVTYPNNVKAARMTAVRDLMDAGSGAGKLEIGTAGMAAVLATIPLSDPAGTISAGVLTLSGFPKSDTADATGTAAAARIRDSDNNDVITGLTVGIAGSGANVEIDNTNIATGQTITINSAVFNHA